MTAPPRNGNGNGNAIQRAQSQPTIKDLLLAAQDRVQAVIPKHLSAERLTRVALMAISRTPKLAECHPESLLNSFMQSAQLGLDCGGPLGEAYLVAYYNGKVNRMEAQFQVGYRGLITLARRSGEIETIDADVVRVGDEFVPPRTIIDERGYRREFRHESRGSTTAAITHAFAVARLKGAAYQICVMSKEEIDAIRSRSKSGQNGPWVTDYAEMAKKTVIKRLAKLLPLSPEMAEAIETSDKNEFGALEIEASVVDAQDRAAASPAPGKKSRAAALAEKAAAVEPEHAPVDVEGAPISEPEQAEQPESAPQPEPQQAAPAPQPARRGRPAAQKAPTAPEAAPVQQQQHASSGQDPRDPSEICDEYVETVPLDTLKSNLLTLKQKKPGIYQAALQQANISSLVDASDADIKNVAWNARHAELTAQ
jgi:recombination protein RecT